MSAELAWRVGRGWSEPELRERLARLPGLKRNFRGTHEDHLADPDWETHGSRSVLGHAPPGPPQPGGPFALGCEALRRYAFSDPGIVESHFDPRAPLAERRMLLELKVSVLHYLCGVAVGAVVDEGSHGETRFGFRYDTLEGHIERGSEWFVLSVDHPSGALTFEIEATWRTGDFPNWWSRLGFHLVGRRMQRQWHTRAHARMAAFVEGRPAGPPLSGHLAHEGPEVTFTGGTGGASGRARLPRP